MSSSPERSLTRDRAWSCVSLNFSLAGLGSLKAGRKFSGACQLIFAFGGFFLILAWIFKWCLRISQSQLGETDLPSAPAWLWKLGAACFVISYTWMLLTCWSLMRRAKANEAHKLQSTPPRLDDLDKPPKL